MSEIQQYGFGAIDLKEFERNGGAFILYAAHLAALAAKDARIAELEKALRVLLRDSMRSDYTVRRTAFEQARAALKEEHHGE